MNQWVGKIHNGDAIKIMNEIPSQSIGTIVTSPPYNLKNSTGSGMRSKKGSKSGSKWRVQSGLIQDLSEILKGFPVKQIIIWRRKGGMNFNPGYFLPTYEVIYLITKPDFILAPKANTMGDI